MSYVVIKRDGTEVPFDISKISSAIRKSFASLNRETDDSVIELLALRTTADFSKKVSRERINVEDIQDSVETILSLAGYADVAKSYILYRKQREGLRRLSQEQSGYVAFIKDYLKNESAAEEEESKAAFSVGGLTFTYSGGLTRDYWLNQVFDEQLKKAHQQGWLHIHNLDFLGPVSVGWDIGPLIEEGFSLPNQIHSRPARHLDALCSQLADLLAVMQQEWAGAQSVSHFDTYLAPFVKKDALSDEEISSALETFIYGVNAPTRLGTQPPFVNVTFDGKVPEDWKDRPACGVPECTYGECEPEIQRIQQQFFRICAAGDLDGRGLPFPIPVIRHPDKDNKYLYEAAAKYGNPVFARNSTPMEGYFSYEGGKCCAGAVTLNLPRMAYVSETEDEFFQTLDEYLDLAIRALQDRQTLIERLYDSGLYPCTKSYWHRLPEIWNSIGIIGLNEACLNARFVGSDLRTEAAQAFGQRVLVHIRHRLDKEPRFVLYATPAEGVSGRLAALDRQAFQDIHTCGIGDIPYYSNSTLLANDLSDDLMQEVVIQEKLQPYFNGGSFFSIPFDRKAEGSQLQLIADRLRERTCLPVFAFTPAWHITPQETWIRVSGYYRPLSEVNASKLQEYKDRKNYLL